jgi:hypothetical protein
VKDSSAELSRIEEWFGMWPMANLGIDLSGADLIDVAPDSPEWFEEFHRRGLRENAPSWQSGSGEGHAHYLFRRPADCPVHRLCRPDEYDILSNGYSIVPPSANVIGPYVWLTPLPASLEDIPQAPRWVVDMLQEAVQEPQHTTPGPPLDYRAFPAPPVRLGPKGMGWWSGSQYCSKQGGEVDRSETLFTIGLCLASRGAPEDVVAAAVADRDRVLGYNKYSNRPDGGDLEYRRIAAKALGIGRSQVLAADSTSSAANGVADTRGSEPTTSSTLPTPIDWSSFWDRDRHVEDWLCEPILPRGRAVATFSPAKVGKSLLALDVAGRLATGQRCLDHRAGDPLDVVYLDLEMTEDDVYERLEDMGYGPETDFSHLHYYLLPNLPPLDTPNGGQVLLQIVRKHRAALVIVDTTSRVLSGGENDADTLRAFYQFTGLSLKGEGCTVWRLDHAGKDLARGQRGTSAKADDVDLVWELTTRDSGLRLRATHRRQGWVPELVDLVKLEDPLRHERAAQSVPQGTLETAHLLDELEIPLEWGKKRIRQALTQASRKVANAVLEAAIRHRKGALSQAGAPSHQTARAPGAGTLFGESTGTTRAPSGTYPQAPGAPVPPSMGGTCPSPTTGGNNETPQHLPPLAAEVLNLSAERQWSTLRLSSAETINGGEENWRRFVEMATPERLTRAREALEAER